VNHHLPDGGLLEYVKVEVEPQAYHDEGDDDDDSEGSSASISSNEEDDEDYEPEEFTQKIGNQRLRMSTRIKRTNLSKGHNHVPQQAKMHNESTQNLGKYLFNVSYLDICLVESV